LAFSVRAKTKPMDERRTANLTFVSTNPARMAADSKMNYLKRGLQQGVRPTETGRLGQRRAIQPPGLRSLTNFVVGRGRSVLFRKAVDY
jgi:hypothetical protein